MPVQGEHRATLRHPSHTEPPTGQPQSQPAQDKQGLPGAGSTDLRNSEREKDRGQVSQRCKRELATVTSSSVFAQVCWIVVLKPFHLGKPSLLVLKVMFCLPGLSPLSGPVSQAWLVTLTQVSLSTRGRNRRQTGLLGIFPDAA